MIYWIAIYAAGHLVGSVGPLPSYQCEQVASASHSLASRGMKLECVQSARRPRERR